MGDANDEHKSDDLHQSPGATIIIRWWRERGTPEPGDEDRVLRGKVLDVSGRTVGSFAGIDALFDILAHITLERPRQAQQRQRRQRRKS